MASMSHGNSITMSTSLLSPTGTANNTTNSFANNTFNNSIMTPQSSLMDTIHLVSSSSSSSSSGSGAGAGAGSGGEEENDEGNQRSDDDERDSNDQDSHRKQRELWRKSTGDMLSSTADTRSHAAQPFRRTAPPNVQRFGVDQRNSNNNPKNGDNDNDEPAPKYYHPAYWNARLARIEVYSKHYKPTRNESEEIDTLEKWLGIPDARQSRNKTVIVQQWMQLHPSSALAASQNSPVSIVLKRGPVAWNAHQDCELILLTRGFVLARRVFQYIPRFQVGELWTNVERVMPTGMTSFAIVCGAMKTLEFQCPTVADQQAWMNALRVVVLQSYTHSAAIGLSPLQQRAVSSSEDDIHSDPFSEGWQYRLVQTPWFSEAVTGHVRLDSNMLDAMDNRDLVRT